MPTINSFKNFTSDFDQDLEFPPLKFPDRSRTIISDKTENLPLVNTKKIKVERIIVEVGAWLQVVIILYLIIWLFFIR
ncbi:MAG: hypothetical protein H7Y00_13260 [Fimbriimonadaceae bacterium]|nr:hypothetical protein [Chitinophagales bacterium]